MFAANNLWHSKATSEGISIMNVLEARMEDSKVFTNDQVPVKNESIDFEITECESIEATANIMGLPGGSIMEGAFFVYRF